MADAFPTLAKTTTSTSGTANYVIGTAVSSEYFQTPKQAVARGSLSNGDIVHYHVLDETDIGDATYERGLGVYTDATNEISRLAANVLDGSSGPGALVSWPGSGTRTVLLLGMPPELGARTDRANTFTQGQSIVKTDSAYATLLEMSNNSGLAIIQDNTTGNAVYLGVNNAATEWYLNWDNGSGQELTIKNSGEVSTRAQFGVGISSPSTNLHIQENNTDTTPGLEIENLSTGDAGLQLSISGDAYSLAIDNSDNDYLKISYASAAGTAVAGTNDVLVIDGPNARLRPFNISSASTSSTVVGVRNAANSLNIIEFQEGTLGGAVVVNSTATRLAALTSVTDPRILFSDDGAGNVFGIGIDDTDGKLKIEDSIGTFSSPLITIDASRFELNSLLLNLDRTSTAADPTTTEYPNTDDVGVHKNTTSGNRFFVWNDGGVIVKVQMT